MYLESKFMIVGITSAEKRAKGQAIYWKLVHMRDAS